MKKINWTARKYVLKKNTSFFNIKFSINKKNKKRCLFLLNKVKTRFLFIKHNKKVLLRLKDLKLNFLNNKKNSNLTTLKVLRNQLLGLKKQSLIFLQNKQQKALTYSLYNNFLLFIFKTGKKNTWEQKFTSLFDILSKKLHYSKAILMLKLFTRLFTRVESKKIKSRKRITYLPFFIKTPRSLFLSLKWVFLAAVKKKGNISFKNKLYTEVVQILTQKSSFSLQKVEENNISAFKNRSNIHYRWQKTR